MINEHSIGGSIVKASRKLILTLVIVSTLVAAFGGVGSANAQALNGSCGQIHVIKSGENLFRIALRYGVTVAQLQQWNAISNANQIYAGQSLCIVGGQPTPPPPTGKVHTVWYGDTLSKIARTYGVDMWVLARVNNIVNVNYITVGQKLSIPDFTIQ
jgi:LysM repeat protein